MSATIVRTVTDLRRSPVLGTPGAAPAEGALDAFEEHARIELPNAYRAFLALHDGWKGLGSVALFDLADQLSWRKRLLAIDPTFSGHAIGVDHALGGILCLELSQAKRGDAPVICIGEAGADIAFASFTDLLSSTLLARKMLDALEDGAPAKKKKAAPAKKKAAPAKKEAAPAKKKAAPAKKKAAPAKKKTAPAKKKTAPAKKKKR